MSLYFYFFFFQAEDGIRDYKVTGVQTCALPIWAVRVFEVAGEVEGERIHCEDARPAGAQRRKRLLVRVVAVGGEDDERIHAGLLPVAEQVVHPAVQRLAAHRGVAGERAAGGGVDAVFDRRRAQDLEGRREGVGETLDDERVAAERERSEEHTSELQSPCNLVCPLLL